MQAVVLADSFASNFRPVTFQQPKVLMPLVNVPMLEYTCEFLAAGGMHEIFIFCCSHKEEVKRYIHESELERRLGTVRLHVLIASGPCFSAGDAIREIAAMDVITSDFVLVPGVAFDGCRGRLGHGAGFYDTWFAALAAGGAAPARVGVALADQLLPNSRIPDCPAAVPREAHDEVLDAVVVAKRA